VDIDKYREEMQGQGSNGSSPVRVPKEEAEKMENAGSQDNQMQQLQSKNHQDKMLEAQFKWGTGFIQVKHSSLCSNRKQLL
jgi:hypothetical protein